MRYCFIFLFTFLLLQLSAQTISSFTSVTPGSQTSQFIFPSTTHAFQKIIEHSDPVIGGTMMDNFDFTGYVPVGGSSTNAHLSINHELTLGGVTVMDISLNPMTKLWSKSNVTPLNFVPVNGTARNCSGGITQWGNVITCEETTTTTDNNNDGYYDLGWHVETNPITKTVVQKLWALGNGPKENIVIHSNRRTAYFGNDANPGYLYKFVANTSDDLTNGTLYVYTGPKVGSGTWVVVPNTTQTERNTTMALCAGLGGTVFNGVEDVEIGPDGMIYLAVKNENRVYRFQDSDPITGVTTTLFDTYVGNMSYPIAHAGGTTTTAWGTGNDNLAFDGQGNLWVLQDGDNDYIWVVMNGHTQSTPLVKLFGITPAGGEPTGITFTPDYKYLFLSFQHPSSVNGSDTQLDASGIPIGFDKDIAIVIALDIDLGCPQLGQACDDNNPSTLNDTLNGQCVCQGIASTALQQETLSISNGDADAEQNNSTGAMDLNSTDIELVTDGTVVQTCGLRFTGLNVPTGAIVTEAYVQFTTDETSSASTVIDIYCEKQVSPSVFANTTNNLSARTKTTQKVTWEIPAWNVVDEQGPNQKTPNLSAIINEVVGMPGWISGNPIHFIITGTGGRTAEAYNGVPASAAKLIITYQTLNTASNVGIDTSNPQSKLHINQGNIYTETIGTGLIIKSPNGQCWKLIVSDTGVVSSVLVECP